MNRHQHWILQAAVELRMPLRVLTSPNLEEILNRPHHGLDSTGVVRVLRELLQQGLIVLCPGRGALLQEAEEELRRLIEGGDRRPFFETTYYGLTSLGGEAWEQVARPD